MPNQNQATNPTDTRPVDTDANRAFEQYARQNGPCLDSEDERDVFLAGVDFGRRSRDAEVAEKDKELERARRYIMEAR